jgi:hypothetical protein
MMRRPVIVVVTWRDASSVDGPLAALRGDAVDYAGECRMVDKGGSGQPDGGARMGGRGWEISGDSKHSAREHHPCAEVPGVKADRPLVLAPLLGISRQPAQVPGLVPGVGLPERRAAAGFDGLQFLVGLAVQVGGLAAEFFRGAHGGVLQGGAVSPCIPATRPECDRKITTQRAFGRRSATGRIGGKTCR